MDLYVCGNNRILEPNACDRPFTDKPNPCDHVPSGSVTGDNECPHVIAIPKRVLQNKSKIKIRSLAAGNIIVSDGLYYHALDHETLMENTMRNIRKQIKDENIQHIWYDDEAIVDHYDSDDEAVKKIPSTASSPREPPTGIGLVCTDGAIFHVEQHPFQIAELTTPSTRRPFLYAMIVRELTAFERDKHPVIVLPEQPDLAYRFTTISELTHWLGGEKVRFQTLRFMSPVTRLFGKKDGWQNSSEFTYFVTTEDGSAYYWCTYGTAGHGEEMTLIEALSRPSSLIPITIPTIKNEETATQFIPTSNLHGSYNKPYNEDYFGKFALPPIAKIDVGINIGAAVSGDGRLFVFSPIGTRGSFDISRAHLLDLDDGTSSHHLPLPCMVREASISLNRTVETVFIDVAVGQNHIVALRSDGRVFTAGDAIHGQLGIGDRRFDIERQRPKVFWGDYDYPMFCDEWQEVDVVGAEGKGRVVGVGAQMMNSLFVVDATGTTDRDLDHVSSTLSSIARSHFQES